MNIKRKLIRTYRQTLEGTREEIFPLLCPVREKEWLQGWDYEMMYSESGFAEKGCVFETNNDYGSYRWVVTEHDQECHRIQFVKMQAKDICVIIDIRLTVKSEKWTFCDIQYTFVPLNCEAAEQIYRENTEEVFNGHMKKWEKSLNHYLKHAEMLLEE
ncbi:hypothetical protein [Anoxynatronum buryatiense]|nr:hypothetical protein [Anoxynatronum buryatiense]